MTVRVRIAPSPTGDPHVGTAYIALMNQVFARSQRGKFILRIEDTDFVRSTRASERAILEALRWLGLDWDEGPDVGGDCGPYRQSERKEIYREYADRLLAQGAAFHCFCTPARLDELRALQAARGETTGYDGRCLSLDPAEVRARIASGEPHVVRMKVPTEGVSRFNDVLRGDIEIPYSQIDMQVLMKADGFPTYHMAVVVDDHLMRITHILRGEEWINSVPKHVLLYRYFGWQPPVFCHLPLLRNPDRSKLSKRRNPTSINYYRRSGYLPEALINYLGRMGWSMPDEREMFGRDEMIESFDLQRISLGGPVFDLKKLDWLNGQYIRRLSAHEFLDRVRDWAFRDDQLEQLVPLVQERTERLIDLVPLAGYLIGERRPLAPADFAHKDVGADDVKRILQFTLWWLDEVRDWQRETLHAGISRLAETMQFKIRDFLFPLFVAISGQTVSLPLYDSMIVLGADLTRTRIRNAIDVLGGLSKKQTKQWEKDYRALVDTPPDAA
ncbi:MAG TPA: glutamate--tRNA ligase [Pseudomonadales bacterium]|nr:glutamate--tRNA ligase [Pseudomonadales bacterium]